MAMGELEGSTFQKTDFTILLVAQEGVFLCEKARLRMDDRQEWWRMNLLVEAGLQSRLLAKLNKVSQNLKLV
jgi:hypothetical protein